MPIGAMAGIRPHAALSRPIQAAPAEPRPTRARARACRRPPKTRARARAFRQPEPEPKPAPAGWACPSAQAPQACAPPPNHLTLLNAARAAYCN